ncbi:MAG: RluA family pseudouridine synthase [Proteobacteria bacterium]|nr:RluA family pseudouridine synthase [Pseudomonadota bacterium]
MNPKYSFKVPEISQGQRLDRCLTDWAPDLSRSRIKSLIDQGLVSVEDRPAKASQKLKTGQSVDLIVPEVRPSELEADPGVAFDVLYQDEDVIVINKPAGLVVHPGAGHQGGTLVHGLLAVCDDLAGVGGEARPGIVHRLDKDTSGVMIAAKSDRAHQALVEAFKGGGIRKTYLALCRRWPDAERGEIDAPIGRHPVRRKEMSTRSRAGRPALTRWEILRRYGLGASLLQLRILTGRTHQIRVHLASLGCPVLGDRVYGSESGGTGGAWKPLKNLLTRQMLHARALGFQHPVTGQDLEFEAPLPPDMDRLMTALEESGQAPPRSRVTP